MSNFSVLIEKQPSPKEIDKLEKKCKSYDNISISISFGSPSAISADCDLLFLKKITNLSRLYINYAFNQKELSFLGDLSRLTHLKVYGINRPLSMKVLSKLPRLEVLEIEKQGKDFEFLAENPNLKELSLHNVNIPSFTWTTCAKKLTILRLTLTKSKDYASLTPSRIKVLKLWDLKAETDLTWIQNFSTLEKLGLWGMRRVAHLPSMKKLINLSYIEIFGMSSIQDLSPLMEAKALEEICCKDAIHMKSGDFALLSAHPCLKRGNIHLKTDMENKKVRDLLKLQYCTSNII